MRGPHTHPGSGTSALPSGDMGSASINSQLVAHVPSAVPNGSLCIFSPSRRPSDTISVPWLPLS